MKQFILCIIAISVIGCSHSPKTSLEKAQNTASKAKHFIKSPNDPREYKTLTLDNEMDVILISDPKTQKSAAALSVDIGWLFDPKSQPGMAHYLEHMLFLGTEKYPTVGEYQQFMAQNGGSNNAFTSYDITNYHFSIKNDAYLEALDRFADFFKTAKLDPKYGDKERNAINAEWSIHRENDNFGIFAVERRLMGDHPANKFFIGNLDTLKDKPDSKLQDELVKFYNTYYSANLMKLVLLSNQPISEMERLAKDYFSDVKNKKHKRFKVTEQLDLNKAAGNVIHFQPNRDSKRIVLQYIINNNTSEYHYKANSYVSHLLGSEMPGAPAQVLRDKGWITSLSAGASPRKYGNYGSFSIHIELTEIGLKHREDIIATVMHYLELVKQKGIDKAYYQELKNIRNNSFQFLEKTEEVGYVTGLASAMQNYNLHEVVSAPYTYGHYNTDKIQEVFNQLVPERLNIWFVGKDEPVDKKLYFYDYQYKVSKISQAMRSSWKKPLHFKIGLPSINDLLPENFDIKNAATYEKPKLVIDTPTVKTWHYPSQLFKTQPKGILRIWFNSPMESLEDRLLLNLWTQIYNIQNATLFNNASSAGMNINLSANNGVELSLSGFTNKQVLLTQKALATLFTININTKDFTNAVDQYIRSQKSSLNAPVGRQLGNRLGKVVYKNGTKADKLISTMKKLTLNDLNQFINRVASHNQIRIFAFGNYDQTQLNKINLLLQASLPSSHTPSTLLSKNKIILPEPGKTYIYSENIQPADVGLLDLCINPQPTYHNRAAASLLRSHISNKTFRTLRTEEQLAYSVFATSYNLKEFSGLALGIQTPVKNPKDMQTRFDKFKQEYANMLENLTLEEFNNLKTSVLTSLHTPPKNLSEEFSRFTRDWYDENWDFNTRQKVINATEKLTFNDIKQYYKETMLNPNAARLVIQLKGNKFSNEPFASYPKGKEIKNLENFHKNIRYQK